MTSTDLWWQNTIVANPFLWDETTMGIDWGESTNAWALVGYQGKVIASGSVTETPVGLETLLKVLRDHAHPVTGDLPPVAIETPRRLLVAALAAEGVEVIPLNPRSVKVARKVKQPRNQTKTDPLDAVLIANVRRNNPQDYHSLHASSQQARAITLLHRAREEAVRGAIRQAGRVRSALAEYHPNATDAFTTEQMADNLAAYWVLRDALTPADAARLRADGIATRMMKPGGRGSAKGLDQAAERVRDALKQPSLAYPAEFEAAFAETVRTDLEVLRTAVEHRVVVDKRFRDAVRAHPLWHLLSPAKGAGEAAIGGLIAEMGDDPHRFNTAKGLMAFAGSAPAIDQSGGRSSVRRRDVKGNRLNQAMWHWAGSVAMHEPGAQVYYWTIRSKGSAHPHALRKVINKLLRGVHACIRNGTVWDDDRIWRTALTPEEVDEFVSDVRAQLKTAKQAKRKVTGLPA